MAGYRRKQGKSKKAKVNIEESPGRWRDSDPAAKKQSQSPAFGGKSQTLSSKRVLSNVEGS
jgi:hypothetical protein